MIETPVHQEILFFDDFMHQTSDVSIICIYKYVSFKISLIFYSEYNGIM
jgi:hypothetical protein